MQQYSSKLDSIAVMLGGVCMLHCLALPFVLTLLPLSHGLLLNEQSFHLLMLLFILPTSVIALAVGCRKHRDRPTLVLGAAGLTILMVTALAGHELFGLTGERLVTSVGSLVLASAHIRNFRICRRADCSHD